MKIKVVPFVSGELGRLFNQHCVRWILWIVLITIAQNPFSSSLFKLIFQLVMKRRFCNGIYQDRSDDKRLVGHRMQGAPLVRLLLNPEAQKTLSKLADSTFTVEIIEVISESFFVQKLFITN